jgi:predicted secreted protein
MSIAVPLRVRFCALALAVVAMTSALAAQGTSGDARPYDDKLLRLCEILGAVHYLR